MLAALKVEMHLELPFHLKLLLYSTFVLLYFNPKTSAQAWCRFNIYFFPNVDIYGGKNAAEQERRGIFPPNAVCSRI